MNYEVIPGKSKLDALKEEILRLREEIVALTAERDELLLRECPRIQAEYNATVGKAALELYRAKSRVLQLRRAIEILQAARNRQEIKEASAAKQEAKEAYAEYEKEIFLEAEKVREANEYQHREKEQDEDWQRKYEEDSPGSELSVHKDEKNYHNTRDEQSHRHTGDGQSDQSEVEEEKPVFRSRSDAIKYYYRKLVKLLHPDANPDQTEEDRQLFLEVQHAVRDGDLDKLIEIYEFLRIRDAERTFFETTTDIAKLEELADSLKKKRDALLEEIERIRNSFPYKAKEILENPEELEKVLAKLRDSVIELDEQCEVLQKRFDRLANGKDVDEDDGEE